MIYANTSFTMGTPIIGPLAEWTLERVLDVAKGNREFGPLKRISVLHLAGFGKLSELRNARGNRKKLRQPFLLFFSLFDGAANQYLQDFQLLVPDEIDSIWGKCTRYPGARSGETFIHWLETHALAQPSKDPNEATTYEFHGYRIDPEGLTVDNRGPGRNLAPMPLVQKVVELRRRLLDLKRHLASGAATQQIERQLWSLAAEML